MDAYLDTSLVSVDWLNSNINAKNLILLDATINKTIDANALRLPYARFFDIKQKFSDTSARFPSALPTLQQFQTEARKLDITNTSVIVVYDDKGIYSSARAWWLFKTFGHKNVAVLDGGLPAWLASGFKLDNYTNETYYNCDFEAVFQTKLMTNFNGVIQFSKDCKTLILDARSQARFKGLVDEPREGLRRGTIANSKNLPYTELFNGNKLKTVTELSKIFNNLVTQTTTLVFSCGSGITACILALAATQCGFKKLVVYDGSWTEYGTLIK